MSAADGWVDVPVSFAPPPEPLASDERFELRLPAHATGPVRLLATLAQPGLVRDALLTLGDTLASDLRFKARDRADYLAYLVAKGKGVSQAVWDAQKEFLQLKYGEAAKLESPLPPVATVSSDGLRLEVFSRDESTYGQLLLRKGALDIEQSSEGSAYVDFTPRLVRTIARMRSYRPSTLGFSTAAGAKPETLRVPHRWLHAFGQMQAAGTLPSSSFELLPVDLYNILMHLRLHKAKQSPRALRYELIPGERPRLVLEPWDLVLSAHGPAYAGKQPLVVRTFGRNRLSVLGRILPHARRVHVHVLGHGLPTFYVVELDGACLTLALSGWTDSGWAGIATFDLLAPTSPDPALTEQILGLLGARAQSLAELAERTGRDASVVRQSLLLALEQGVVGNDLAAGTFFKRALLPTPLPEETLRFRDARERAAHRLLDTPEQVQLTRMHDLGGDGTRIEGEIADRKGHRSYRTSFTLDREGRSVDVGCTCPSFRRSGMKEGPCEHMMALRIAYARHKAQLEAARHTEAGRKLIRAETRSLLRRKANQITICRISLDDRQLVLRYGRPDQLRMQRLLFSTAEEARLDYFNRLTELGQKGFIDASAAE
jgi:hypothetical protein